MVLIQLTEKALGEKANLWPCVRLPTGQIGYGQFYLFYHTIVRRTIFYVSFHPFSRSLHR